MGFSAMFGRDVADIAPREQAVIGFVDNPQHSQLKIRKHGAGKFSILAPRRQTMNPNEYLLKFFAEFERLIDGHGTRHNLSTTRAGELEVCIGAGDWYRAA